MKDIQMMIPRRFKDSVPRTVRVIYNLFTSMLPLPQSEASEKEILTQHIRKGDTVLEVGARVGGSSLLLSSLVGPAGRVFVFEPNPYSFRILRRNTRALQNVQLFNLAVSDSVGHAYLSMSELFAADASLVFLGKPERLVRTVTLDNMMMANRLPKADALVIDAEGSELAVLSGSRGLLGTLRCALVEIHFFADQDIEDRIDELLTSNGLFRVRRVLEPTNREIILDLYVRDESAGSIP